MREYDRLWLERGPVELDGEIALGRVAHPLRRSQGLRYEAGGPATGSPGRTKKIQDVFVDAKVPRSEREAWPLVVRGDDVIAVPGIVEHPEVEAIATHERDRARARGHARS